MDLKIMYGYNLHISFFVHLNQMHLNQLKMVQLYIHLLNNHRRIMNEFEIKNFVRYRDGGTTIITVVDNNGNEHKFFSPTSLPTKTTNYTTENIMTKL